MVPDAAYAVVISDPESLVLGATLHGLAKVTSTAVKPWPGVHQTVSTGMCAGSTGMHAGSTGTYIGSTGMSDGSTGIHAGSTGMHARSTETCDGSTGTRARSCTPTVRRTDRERQGETGVYSANIGHGSWLPGQKSWQGLPSSHIPTDSDLGHQNSGQLWCVIKSKSNS